jgi:hypothetical protein
MNKDAKAVLLLLGVALLLSPQCRGFCVQVAQSFIGKGLS